MFGLQKLEDLPEVDFETIALNILCNFGDIERVEEINTCRRSFCNCDDFNPHLIDGDTSYYSPNCKQCGLCYNTLDVVTEECHICKESWPIEEMDFYSVPVDAIYFCDLYWAGGLRTLTSCERCYGDLSFIFNKIKDEHVERYYLYKCILKDHCHPDVASWNMDLLVNLIKKYQKLAVQKRENERFPDIYPLTK